MADRGLNNNIRDDPNNEIHEAYAFFCQKVRDWAQDSAESDLFSRFEQLRITICDLLKVVSITLGSDDNAQVIFETLNARGTPLLALDLVKNAIFLEATHQNLDTDALYEKVWQPQLEQDYWRMLRSQGRLYRPNADLFLMHWLIMKLRRVTPATELFKTFRESILAAKPLPDVAKLIVELCSDAQTMRSFDQFDPKSTEGTFFRRLETLDTSTVLSLVLLLFRERAVNPDRRRRAIRILESWLVRRMLMGYSAKNYNQLVPVILNHVAERVEEADDAILEELRGKTGGVDVWPRDDDLRQRLTQKPLYGWISQGRIAMVLGAVEESLRTHFVETDIVPKGLSIEHIMPQSWEANWPLAADHNGGGDLEAAAADRNAHINRLGNLTLTAGPLNSSLSNSAWKQKQPNLNANTVLLLNTRLIETYPECFDEDAINARGAMLAHRIASVWPGPDSW